MFPPPLNRSTIGVRQYKRHVKRRTKRLRQRLGATAKNHALRVSPVRHSRTTKPIHKSSARSMTPALPTTSPPQHRTRAEARARMFAMKRRIVDRLLQKKASETPGNMPIRQDVRDHIYFVFCRPATVVVLLVLQPCYNSLNLLVTATF